MTYLKKNSKLKIILLDSIIAFLISTVTYIFTEITTEWKIILILSLFIISLFITMFRLDSLYNDNTKKIEQELLDLKKKHKAISAQYKIKSNSLKWYKKAWIDINYHITMLKSSKQSERISAMQEYYIKLSKELPEEDD